MTLVTGLQTHFILLFHCKCFLHVLGKAQKYYFSHVLGFKMFFAYVLKFKNIIFLCLRVYNLLIYVRLKVIKYRFQSIEESILGKTHFLLNPTKKRNPSHWRSHYKPISFSLPHSLLLFSFLSLSRTQSLPFYRPQYGGPYVKSARFSK